MPTPDSRRSLRQAAYPQLTEAPTTPTPRPGTRPVFPLVSVTILVAYAMFWLHFERRSRDDVSQRAIVRRTGTASFVGIAIALAVLNVTDWGAGVFQRSLNLVDVDLKGSRLPSADLQGADLSYADLSGADFSGADLRGAIFKRAELKRLEGSRTSIQEADLRGADMTEVQVVWNSLDIQGSDLRAVTNFDVRNFRKVYHWWQTCREGDLVLTLEKCDEFQNENGTADPAARANCKAEFDKYKNTEGNQFCKDDGIDE